MAATTFEALLYRENELPCLPDFLEDLIFTRGLQWYYKRGSRPCLRGKSKIGKTAVLFSRLHHHLSIQLSVCISLVLEG
uniref:Uncharacterized protein n=1 Tax=Amphimedon queenslandica TaxID=400682 RepID=A0A1X7U6P9_AMPQE